jgi:phosphate transport system protein
LIAPKPDSQEIPARARAAQTCNSERHTAMREVFHQSLDDVQGRLVEIAELVTIAITKATTAFATSDVALAEEVIEDDRLIDARAVVLDELAIEILARQQPVARDLRMVVSALRMSASLERMGDMAEHIAQLARYRFPERAIPKGLKSTFTSMGELDVQIATQLADLLRTQDLTIADEIRNLDDDIDELHARVFEKVLSDTWKGEAGATVDATLASRYHERFADHAVSVAKKAVYLATGDWTAEGETSENAV